MKQTSRIAARTMRSLALALLIASSGLTTACGDDGGGGSSGSPPTISQLSYQPRSLTVGQRNDISVTFHFEEPDGDTDQILVQFTLPDGSVQDSPALSAQAMRGMVSGTLELVLALQPQAAGSYAFEVTLTDSEGHESNSLRGSLTAE